MVNWERLKGHWKQLQGVVQEKWGKLTGNELERIAGEREQLIGKLQEKYGLEKEMAELQLHDLLDELIRRLDRRQKV